MKLTVVEIQISLILFYTCFCIVLLIVRRYNVRKAINVIDLSLQVFA
jgi:hypothetical protein